MKKTLFFLLLIQFQFASLFANSMLPNLGDKNCDSLLLISSWTRNNVKIYDGCNGKFVRNLDSQNLIDGPLGILQAPDGDILLISENNSSLIKFDFETLSKGHLMMGGVSNNFIKKPSGAVIDENGMMYVASYTLNSVVKVDTTDWKVIDEMLPSNNGLIKGIDAGLNLSDSGDLYLPGYLSNNVIKINLSSKQASIVIKANTGGLKAPRTVLVWNDQLIVSAEKSNAIMLFDKNTGQFKETLLPVVGPSGMQKDGKEHLIINNYGSAFKLSNSGLSVERVVKRGEGDLAGGTFIYRLKKKTNRGKNDEK
jgi:hypothetical protein